MATQAEELRSILEKSPLFSLLEENLFEGIIAKFEILHFELGEAVIRKGGPGDSFYVVFSGRARVVDAGPDGNELTLATLSRGDFFGERALMKDEPRSATVRAASDLVVARLAKEDFVAAVERYPEAKKFLADYIAHEAMHNFLRGFTVLSALTANEVKVWVDHLKKERFGAGDYVFREGDPPGKFYIIMEGRADVLRKEEDGEKLVNTLREGQFFGELALLTQKPRLASIRAKTDLVALTLSKEHFETLVLKSEKLKEKISNVIALYNLDLVPEELPFKVVRAAEPMLPPPPPRPKLALVGREEAKRGEPKAPYRPRRRGLFRRAFKRLRYPWIEQYDETDCGAACLAMISKYYSKRFSVTRLRDLANVSREGATLLSVAKAAEALGYKTRAVKATYENLMKLPRPCIVHWMGYHYIVLYEIDKGGVLVGDPGEGLVRKSKKDFLEGWTNYALILEPGPGLDEVQEARTSLGRFLSFIYPFKVLLGEVFLCSLLISLFGLATPIFTQLIVDNIVVHQNLTLLNTVLVGIVLLTVFNIGTQGLRTYLMTHVSNKVELTMLSRFYRHLLMVPVRFFHVRKVGDILARFEENDKIKEMLTSKSLETFINVLMIIVYLAVMFFYSPMLTSIVLVFLPLFVAVTLGFTPIFRTMSRRQFAAQAASQSFLVESITGVATVKASSAELTNRWKWEGLYSKALNTQFRFALIDLSADSIAQFLETISGVVLLYFGALLVIQGQLSVGQLMAFHGIVNNVTEPVNKLVGMWNEVQEVLISVERLSDVFEVEPEEKPGDETVIHLPRLQGHVKFENVTFGYSEGSEPVLRNVSFEAQPGQMIAIVGRSGSGKTTLMNLLLRFYSPQEGRILIDGYDLQNVSVDSLRRQIGVVLQENYLFSGTIRSNIALSAPEAPFNRVVEAATLAAAHDFISEMPTGYNSDVGERGSALSGGQRQRIAIARALLTDPRVLVFDEATSALDNESEKAIQKNLGAISRDRTTFVIAHRLTTVQNADLILVMDRGIIVERGTHHELMDKRGLYYYLNSQTLAVG